MSSGALPDLPLFPTTSYLHTPDIKAALFEGPGAARSRNVACSKDNSSARAAGMLDAAPSPRSPPSALISYTICTTQRCAAAQFATSFQGWCPQLPHQATLVEEGDLIWHFFSKKSMGPKKKRKKKQQPTQSQPAFCNYFTQCPLDCNCSVIEHLSGTRIPSPRDNHSKNTASEGGKGGTEGRTGGKCLHPKDCWIQKEISPVFTQRARIASQTDWR